MEAKGLLSQKNGDVCGQVDSSWESDNSYMLFWFYTKGDVQKNRFREVFNDKQSYSNDLVK